MWTRALRGHFGWRVRAIPGVRPAKCHAITEAYMSNAAILASAWPGVGAGSASANQREIDEFSSPSPASIFLIFWQQNSGPGWERVLAIRRIYAHAPGKMNDSCPPHPPHIWRETGQLTDAGNVP